MAIFRVCVCFNSVVLKMEKLVSAHGRKFKQYRSLFPFQTRQPLLILSFDSFQNTSICLFHFKCVPIPRLGHLPSRLSSPFIMYLGDDFTSTCVDVRHSFRWLPGVLYVIPAPHNYSIGHDGRIWQLFPAFCCYRQFYSEHLCLCL